MKLDAKKFGLAWGILWGVGLFLLTIISVQTGYAGDFLQLIANVYPGYTISGFGSILGLIEGFIDGFVGGWLLVWIYNKLLGCKKESAPPSVNG